MHATNIWSSNHVLTTTKCVATLTRASRTKTNNNREQEIKTILDCAEPEMAILLDRHQRAFVSLPRNFIVTDVANEAACETRP